MSYILLEANLLNINLISLLYRLINNIFEAFYINLIKSVWSILLNLYTRLRFGIWLFLIKSYFAKKWKKNNEVVKIIESSLKSYLRLGIKNYSHQILNFCFFNVTRNFFHFFWRSCLKNFILIFWFLNSPCEILYGSMTLPRKFVA